MSVDVVALARSGKGVAVETDGRGRWRFPTATVRDGEPPSQAARRACMDRLGADTAPLRCEALLREGRVVVVRSTRIVRWAGHVPGVRVVTGDELEQAIRAGNVDDMATLAAWMRVRDRFA